MNRFFFRIITAVCISVCFLASCSGRADWTGDPRFFYLTDWEINIGGEWIKTKPVPWETSPENGGIGAEDYNGYALYRTSFVIPSSLEDESLVFFIDGIDDADITYLNGFCLGETGQVPRYDTDGRWLPFRSAPSEPRFYILSPRYIRYDGVNEIRIHVFDYAGSGGFSMNQTPVIGPHRVLMEKHYRMKMILGIPRLLVMGFQVITFILLAHFLSMEMTRDAAGRFAMKMLQTFNPLHYLRKVKTGSSSRPDINDERIFRYILFMAVNGLYFFFLFSQLQVKYYFIGDERFWFFMPVVAMYGAFVLVIAVFHREVFGFSGGLSLRRPVYHIWRLYGMVTHPFVYIVVITILLADTPVEAWNNFMTKGIALMCVVLVSLFAATAVKLLITYLRLKNRSWRSLLFREAVVRFLLLLVTVATVIMYISSPSLFYYQVPLVAVFSSTAYLFVSVKFYSSHDVILA